MNHFAAQNYTSYAGVKKKKNTHVYIREAFLHYAVSQISNYLSLSFSDFLLPPAVMSRQNANYKLTHVDILLGFQIRQPPPVVIHLAVKLGDTVRPFAIL